MSRRIVYAGDMSSHRPPGTPKGPTRPLSHDIATGRGPLLAITAVLPPAAGPSEVSRPPTPPPTALLARPRKRRRKCTCGASAAPFAVLAGLMSVPGASATHHEPRHDHDARDVTAVEAHHTSSSLADHFEDVDGQWIRTSDWSLNGRSGVVQTDQNADGNNGTSKMAATAKTAAVSTEKGSSGNSVSAPVGWTAKPRTPYYAVPLIVSMSVLLAVLILVLILVIVGIKRRRRNKAMQALQDDPERAEENDDNEKALGPNEKPTKRRVRISSAVRRRTAHLRRRRGRKDPEHRALAADDMLAADTRPSSHLDADAVSEAIVRAASSRSVLNRQDSTATLRTVSTASLRPEQFDADSVTALNTTAGDLERPSTHSSRATSPDSSAHVPRPRRHRSASDLSVRSIDVPASAPPAYLNAVAASRSADVPSRRLEKSRAIEDPPAEVGEGSGHGAEPPQLDPSQFARHVAIDDKAELSRLAGLGSAPEPSAHVEDAAMSAPLVEDVEAALLEAAVEEGDQTLEPPTSAASAVPAPPMAIVPTFSRFISQPSAPPPPDQETGPDVDASAPPLPSYFPSVSGHANDEEVRREDHTEV